MIAIAVEKRTDLATAVLRLHDPGLILLQVPFLAAFLADIHVVYAAVPSQRALSNAFSDSGAIDELRARANTGDRHAADQLARLLVEQGNVDEAIEALQASANAGNESAAIKLARLLVEQGNIDELRNFLPDAGTARGSSVGPPSRAWPPSRSSTGRSRSK